MRSLPPYVGWFDNPEQTSPAHMPLDDVACPVCGEPRGPLGRVRDDGKSVLINIDILSARDPRSLFFKVHRACNEAHPDRVTDIEHSLVDGIQ